MMLGSGEVTLVGGRTTVPIARIPSEAVVVLSRKSPLGTIGELGYTVTPKTGFAITSLSVLDLSVVRWAVLV